ncbi:glycoside hydrolase family 95 protein [soil metagenome]
MARLAKHVIFTDTPAEEWAEGYPLGNGRLGAMVLGYPCQERISLNHDRLWREFWSFQEHHTNRDIPEIRRLCKAGEWEAAHDLVLTTLPASGKAVYVNPFVPGCDLGIYPVHEESEIGEYQRSLDLDEALVEVSFVEAGIQYKRECFSSWPHGVVVVRLTSSQAGCLSGEVTLSRLLDPDCVVTGGSRLGEVWLEGEFEEGVRFATMVRIHQRGGRLTGGRKEYRPVEGPMPQKDLRGAKFIFRDKDYPHCPRGVSTCYDSADEVVLLIAMATGEGSSSDLLGVCTQKLDEVPVDYAELRADHIRSHQELYRRVNLVLPSDENAAPTRELITKARETGVASAALVEKMFHFGRYLAISSGRPPRPGDVPKAPINLQGLWNQDRRPPWDSDYHLDLNLQMCYWPLSMANLGELMPPVADWFLSLLPQAKLAARDLYGCGGAAWSTICDLRHIGNCDDLCFSWAGGAGAWVAQILWHHWEYSKDKIFLAEKLYPILKEIADFYCDYLTENKTGQLVPIPSASPEMGIKDRRRYSTLSSPSTMDLELIREALAHSIAAAEILEIKESSRQRWHDTLARVPRPRIDERGCLSEWMIDHEPIDVGHRHRSPLVGVCPSDQVTYEDMREYSDAARQLLSLRQSDRASICAFACVWDAQLLARFYEGDRALQEIGTTASIWLLDNLLLSICDWREGATTLNWFPGRKVYQIEASLGMVASIAEMLFQDRRGLLRLLPALPASWPRGEVNGLRSRGGFEVSLQWADGKLLAASIYSLRGEVCRVKSLTGSGKLLVFHADREVEAAYKDGGTEFSTVSGETYDLRPMDSVSGSGSSSQEQP